MMELTYSIQGMHCTDCIHKIKAALMPIAPVIAISLEPPQVILHVEKPLALEALNTLLAKTGDYRLQPVTDTPSSIHAEQTPTSGLKTYYPIFLIAGFITGVTFINNISPQGFNAASWMTQFMAGFFLVFSAFKLLDIRGFAEGYATYDVLAKRWYTYGFLYPFLELGLGLLYLLHWFPATTQAFTVLLMGFSSLGVIQALAKKQTIRCACLGTVLNVPLSSITLIEDALMVLLAGISLSMRYL